MLRKFKELIWPNLDISNNKQSLQRKFLGRNYSPFMLLTILKWGFPWKIINDGKHNDIFLIIHNKVFFPLFSNLRHVRMAVCEWNDWNRTYVPPFDLKEKIVLDVGAGCGESAYFYFQHGARKVIGIESNHSKMKYLELNKRLFNHYGFKFKFYLEKFDLQHLQLNFDFCKIDIDGGEVELLKLKKIDFPLSIEVHSQDLETVYFHLL